ncbi:MAG: flavodoxin family protein [Kiritimatiellae bacterium]|nr:flavodoxin family protein [Kiritimatiellia bacterium]
MKKVLILTSSPNADGNSNTMAAAFEVAARKKGAAVTRLDMNTVQGTGCRGCMACKKTSDRCVLEDGISEVLDALRDTDVLVMAAPVWWLDLPVALRRFVERWLSLVDASFVPRIPPGKTAVLLLSQGEGEACYQDLPGRYKKMLDWLGIKEFHAVRHCRSEENPVRESGVLDEVAKVAQAVG